MSSEEIMQIVNAVTPAAIAIIGVVTSCLKVISSFKSFKNTTAQDIDELREDIKEVLSLLPGKFKLNLHAIYLDTDEKVDLDKIEPKHLESLLTTLKNIFQWLIHMQRLMRLSHMG